MIVHLGVIIIAVALVASNSYTRSATLALEVGQAGRVGRAHVRAARSVTESIDARTRVVAADVLLDGDAGVRAGDHQVPPAGHRRRHAERAHRARPRTSTSRSSGAPTPGATDGDDPRVRQAADPVAVDRRRADGHRHAARRVPRLAPPPPDRPGLGPGRDPGAGARSDGVAPATVARRPVRRPGRRRRVAGLFVVLAGAEPSTDETAETPLLGQPAPEAIGELADGDAVRARPPQGRLGRPQLLPVELRAVPAGAPRARRASPTSRRRSADGAKFYTVVYDDDRENVEAFFAERGRRLAGRVRRRRLDRRRLRRVQGARDVDHRPRRRRARPHHLAGHGRLPRRPAADCCGRALRVTATQRGSSAGRAWAAARVRRRRRSSPSAPAGPTGRARRASGPTALEQRVACPVCQGESVFESRNTASENIRNTIGQLVDEGELDDDEIIAVIESRFGGRDPARAQGVGLRRAGVGAAGGRADLRRSPGWRSRSAAGGGRPPPTSTRPTTTARSSPPRWPARTRRPPPSAIRDEPGPPRRAGGRAAVPAALAARPRRRAGRRRRRRRRLRRRCATATRSGPPTCCATSRRARRRCPRRGRAPLAARLAAVAVVVAVAVGAGLVRRPLVGPAPRRARRSPAAPPRDDVAVLLAQARALLGVDPPRPRRRSTSRCSTSGPSTRRR